jgi:hypothetical protein
MRRNGCGVCNRPFRPFRPGGGAQGILEAVEEIGFQAAIRGQGSILRATRLRIGEPGADQCLHANHSRIGVNWSHVDAVLVVGSLVVVEVGANGGHKTIEQRKPAAILGSNLLQCLLHDFGGIGIPALDHRWDGHL